MENGLPAREGKRLTQETGQKQDCAVLAMAGGGLIGAGMICYVPGVSPGGIQMPVTFCCCGLTMLLMIALICGMDRLGVGGKLSCAAGEKIWPAASFVMFLGALVVIAGWHVFSGIFMKVTGNGRCAVFGAAALVGLGLVLLCAKYQNVTGKAMLLLACVSAYLIEFLFTYTPDILNQSRYVIHHYTAVTQSIYNVAFNEPFTAASSGVYGHYAIFFWPLVKLFGHTPQTITWFFVAESFVSLTLFILIICRLTRSNVLRALAVAAVCNVKVCIDFYPAVYPTRLIWPYVLLAYVLYRDEISRRLKRPGLYHVLGYGLCALAITWNTDSGLVATLAYTLSLWLSQWRSEPPFSRGSLKLYLLSGLGCVCAVAGMVAVVNGYNLLCGGPLVLKDCFFPLLGGEGYVGSLTTQLTGSVSDWLMPVLCFVFAILGGVLSCPYFGISSAGRMPLAFCGIMGLGQSYYFFNRSVAGWGCVTGYFIMCLTALAGDGLAVRRSASLHQAAKYAAGLGSIFYLCVFALNSVAGTPALAKAKIGTGINSMDTMVSIGQEVAASVPKDTYAFGYCTQDVYAYLGWDPGYHKRDASDFFGSAADSAREEFAGQDSLLIGLSNTTEIDGGAGFVLRKKLPQGDPLFCYYEKLGGYDEVSTPVDERDITLIGKDDQQIAGRVFMIKENTLYKVELELAEDTDLAAAKGLSVVFYLGAYYDEPGARASCFVREDRRDYTLYLNSGETGSEELLGQIHVFTDDLSSTVKLDALRVTEIQEAGK